MWPPLAARIATPLAASITDPPPTATSTSQPWVGVALIAGGDLVVLGVRRQIRSTDSAPRPWSRRWRDHFVDPARLDQPGVGDQHRPQRAQAQRRVRGLGHRVDAEDDLRGVELQQPRRGGGGATSIVLGISVGYRFSPARAGVSNFATVSPRPPGVGRTECDPDNIVRSSVRPRLLIVQRLPDPAGIAFHAVATRDFPRGMPSGAATLITGPTASAAKSFAACSRPGRSRTTRTRLQNSA